jgi:hypothetical protein
MPSQQVAGVMGAGRVINMDGEGKAMIDRCGWEALALAVWIMAAIAGRWHHG